MSARVPGGCFHCGEPLPPGAPIWAMLETLRQPVCCVGCKAVAEFIHGQGLDAYYEHRRRPAGEDGLRVQAGDWSVYDDEDLVARYVHRDGSTAEATIDVGGLYCSACGWLLETGLGRHAAVHHVALNPATRRAVVRWDARELGFAGLLAAIAALGFRPAPAATALDGSQSTREQRNALRRLVVAAAAGMQVMMFAVALYAGAHFGIEGRIEQFLRIVSLLVCLPIVFYSARPFFAAAVRGLRGGRPGMDLPVALAIAAAFTASAYATLVNEGEIYFDSVAMFVLFLGGARYLEMRARHAAEDRARAMAGLLPELATRVAGGVPEVVAADRLRVGDQVLLRPGDIIPADGRVLSGELSVDEALLTGESTPLRRVAGAEVFAGGINRAGAGVIELTRVGASTSVAEIGRLIDKAKADRPPLAQLADRIAGWFVVAVLLVAAAAGTAWLAADAQRAFEVMLATLVVTCPCALSLATPASIAAAAARLGRQGILLVHARILDILAKPVHIVFDKTGTLTRGRPAVMEVRCFGAASETGCRALASVLETVSEHVLARAFQAADGRQARVANASVVTGGGVQADVDGRRLRLGNLAFVRSLQAAGGAVDPGDPALPVPGSLVYLGDEHALLACFVLDDEVRDDAAAAVAALRTAGHRASIASGDRAPAVAAVAQSVGITDWHAGLAPQAKLDYLAALRAGGDTVVMVGDGVNDSPVLAAADASIAVDAGTALARASADAVVPGRHLLSVVELADTARRTRRIIAQNLGWAVAYNLCAVPLAVSGTLAPWMAALGMSLSSLLVVGNALRLQRPGAQRPSALPARPAAEDRREALP